MADTILVLNAGSSSIKFSLFAEAGSELALVARGQIEGIDTSPPISSCRTPLARRRVSSVGRRAPSSGTTVVLHLGNGASMCALQAGVSMASDMRTLLASSEPQARLAIDL